MALFKYSLELNKAFEGLHRVLGPDTVGAYTDPVDVVTIGYGTTNQAGNNPWLTIHSEITVAQAEAYLQIDMERFLKRVKRLAPAAVYKNDHERAALVLWSYNTGGPSTSNVWKHLRAGNKSAAMIVLGRWVNGRDKKTNKLIKLPGLVRRRKAEVALFNGDIEQAYALANLPLPHWEKGYQVVVPVPKPRDYAERMPNDVKAGAPAGAGGVGFGVDGLATVDWTAIDVAILAVSLGLLAYVGWRAYKKAKEIKEGWA